MHALHKCTYVRQYHTLRPYIPVRKVPDFDPTQLPYWNLYSQVQAHIPNPNPKTLRLLPNPNPNPNPTTGTCTRRLKLNLELAPSLHHISVTS